MTTPTEPRQLTYMERTARFPLDFRVFTDKNGKPVVNVPPEWRKRNIVSIPLHTRDGKLHTVSVHINAAQTFATFLHAIDGLPETYDGSFVPRLKRTATAPAANSGNDVYGPLLSNHSRGTAVDLNALWNQQGHAGAAAGAQGDMSRIVAAAKTVRVPMETHGHVWEAGIVWGGDWSGKSRDDMHFEIGTFEPARLAS